MTSSLMLSPNDLAPVLSHIRLPLCLTDPNVPDNPIVYCNDAFLELTGYARDEVIGHNCRFLQGADTDPAAIDEIRDALAHDRIHTVEVTNYRKDGTAFVNALQIGPIKDDAGRTILQFGSQLDVSAERARQQRLAQLEARERLHRLRNIATVMTAIIKLTAREHDTVPEFATAISGRLKALSDAHFQTDDSSRVVDPLALSRQVVGAYAPYGAPQLTVTGTATPIGGDTVTALTLALQELAANALKHGAFSLMSGQVHIAWSPDHTGATMVWQETDGPPVTAPDRRSGSQIVQSLVRSSGGTLAYDWNPAGLIATLRLPG